jgi:hypothetical protein
MIKIRFVADSVPRTHKRLHPEIYISIVPYRLSYLRGIVTFSAQKIRKKKIYTEFVTEAL